MTATPSGSSTLVSVVVTTHNYGRFLPEALESVLAQDHEPIEVVVVDDGSTDDTQTVMEPFRSRGVRYIRQPRQGPGPARNTGIRAGTGAYVAFLDADDVWLPGKLSAQAALLDAHPDVAFAAGGRITIGPDGVRLQERRAPEQSPGPVFDRLIRENFIGNPSVVMARRCALDEVGGFSELPLGQDWDTFLALARHRPVGFVAEPVALVRVHGRGVSAVAASRRAEANELILQRHIAALDPGERSAATRASRAWSRLAAARLALSGGNRREAAAFALSSLRLDPRRRPVTKLAVAARAGLPLVATVIPPATSGASSRGGRG